MPLTSARAALQTIVWLLALCVMLAGRHAFAQAVSVAEVVFAQGVVSAQRGAEPARLIGKGNLLYEGEIVTTGRKAFAVLQFSDSSRMTLRPETVFHISEYSHGGQQDNAIMRLVRGGFRAVTGLIAKRGPDAYRITTPTATIGIRGTDFDARLCADDCAAEQKALGARESVGTTPVVGRAVLVNGAVTVESVNGVARALAFGGPVYPGDTLQTGAKALALIAFRDDSRVTLQGDTRFKVEDYRYTPQAPDAGNIVLRLLKGSIRAMTGLLAKSHPQSFQVATVTGLIGVRGSGMDISCEGRCADGNRAPAPPAPIPARGDGLFVHNWQGILELQFGSERLIINENQAAFFGSGATRPVLLPTIPEFIRSNPAPRPDGVPVDLQQLFGAQFGEQSVPGLYVYVRDGHVTLEQDGRVVDLGGGEAGYADPSGQRVVRLVLPPPFLEFDRYPRPDHLDPRVMHIIELITDERPGAPRGTECEVR
jgi:hypothetical protein